MEVEFRGERRQSGQNGNTSRSRERNKVRFAQWAERRGNEKENENKKKRKRKKESVKKEDVRWRKQRGKGKRTKLGQTEKKRNGGANDCRIAPSSSRFRLYRFAILCVLCLSRRITRH